MTQQIEPCPNCGGEMYLNAGARYAGWLGVQCKRCYMHIGFPSPDPDDGPAAIIEWVNSIARAVREAQEQRERAEKDEAERDALQAENDKLTKNLVAAIKAGQQSTDNATALRRMNDEIRKERDALRALIERHNERIDKRCGPPGPGACCGKNPSRHTECGDCPRRYIIELPKEQG